MSLEIGSVAQSCCHLCHRWQRPARHSEYKFGIVLGSHIPGCCFFVLSYPSHLLPACLPGNPIRKGKVLLSVIQANWTKAGATNMFPTFFTKDLRSFWGSTHLPDISGMHQINTISKHVSTQMSPQHNCMNHLSGTKGHPLSAALWYLSLRIQW